LEYRRPGQKVGWHPLEVQAINVEKLPDELCLRGERANQARNGWSHRNC